MGICAYGGTPGAIAAENEKVAAELRTIIDNGEPAIGNEDNDERIVEVYVFYAADRDYKPLWVRDSGPKAKSREVLAVFKAEAKWASIRAITVLPKSRTACMPAPRASLQNSNSFSAAPSSTSAATSIAAAIAEQRQSRKRHHGKGARGSDPDRWRRGRRHIADFVGTLEPNTANITASNPPWHLSRDGRRMAAGRLFQRVRRSSPATEEACPALRNRLQVTGDLPLAAEGGDFYDADLVAAVRSFSPAMA